MICVTFSGGYGMLMRSIDVKRISIVLILVALMVSAFVLRLDNAKKSKKVTIDENVYYCLGLQLKHDGLLKYDAKNCADVLIEMDSIFSPLPAYFYKPLFKHPPLFSCWVALSLKIFGDAFISAGYVSLLFGILLIPLTYLLGKEFFDERIGLLSAFFLWMDPVNIICSQKVWMETTLAFFILLSVYLFAMGERTNKSLYFLFSGISCGLAVLTKYPGILVLVIMIIYIAAYRTDLIKNKTLLLSLLIPFLMLLPWAVWNFSVYGSEFLLKMGRMHSVFSGNTRRNVIAVLFGGVSLALVWKLFFVKENLFYQQMVPVALTKKKEKKHSLLMILIGIVFFAALFPHIYHSFNFHHLPVTTWYSGGFRHPLFYFGQLIEFHFLYVFSFLSFFVYNAKRFEDGALLNMAFFTIMIFFLLWGNYQSRYILAATPILIIIGAAFWMELFEKFQRNGKPGVRFVGCGILIILLAFLFLKTNYINFLVSYPNDMCYF